MRSITLPCTLGIVATLLGATACSSQVDGDYPGQSLASLRGMLVNELPVAPGEAYPSLVWKTSHSSVENIVAETVEVTGEFPAQFQLDVYRPPVDDALAQDGPGLPRYAVGLVMVLDVPGEDFEFNSPDASILGEAFNYLVIYSEAAADSVGGYRGPLQAGFNLLQMQTRPGQPGECPDKEPTNCEVVDFFPTPDGLDTLITITLAESAP